MLFLYDTNISVCQTPTILEIIYFGKLILNIIYIFIPIGLIVFCTIDFCKCLIYGDKDEQIKKTKLVFKRIIYAVLLFSVKYIVGLCMSFIFNSSSDYDLCIQNATPENIKIFSDQYEEQNKIENINGNNSIVEKVVKNVDQQFKNEEKFKKDDRNLNIENLMQNDSKWGNYKLCNGKQTISSGGCGFVSLTMIARRFGNEHALPQEVLKSCCDAGFYGDTATLNILINEDVNKKYGITGEKLFYGFSNNPDNTKNQGALEKVKAALKEDKALIVLIPGHYISLLGINNKGKIVVGDSIRGFQGEYESVEELYEITKRGGNSSNYKDGTKRCNNNCGWPMIMSFSKRK